MGYARARPRIEWTTGIDQMYNKASNIKSEQIYYAMELGEFYFSTRSNAHVLTPDIVKTLVPSGQNIFISTITGSCKCSASNQICAEDINRLRYIERDKLKVVDSVQGYRPSLQGPLQLDRCHVLYVY